MSRDIPIVYKYKLRQPMGLLYMPSTAKILRVGIVENEPVVYVAIMTKSEEKHIPVTIVEASSAEEHELLTADEKNPPRFIGSFKENDVVHRVYLGKPREAFA